MRSFLPLVAFLFALQTVHAYKILFVGASAAPPSSGEDGLFYSWAQSLGHQVTYKNDDTTVSSDANGKQVVVVLLRSCHWMMLLQISSTCDPVATRDWYSSEVGVLTWKH